MPHTPPFLCSRVPLLLLCCQIALLHSPTAAQSTYGLEAPYLSPQTSCCVGSICELGLTLEDCEAWIEERLPAFATTLPVADEDSFPSVHGDCTDEFPTLAERLWPTVGILGDCVRRDPASEDYSEDDFVDSFLLCQILVLGDCVSSSTSDPFSADWFLVSRAYQASSANADSVLVWVPEAGDLVFLGDEHTLLGIPAVAFVYRPHESEIKDCK